MAAALRSVRRLQQVLQLPRICVTFVRAESGGKSSPHTGISKTLVSFPVKVSYYQQPTTGENRNKSLRPVKALLLETGGSSGQLDRESQLGQGVSLRSAQSVHGTFLKENDSSSSSDSESEEEDNGPKKGASGGGHKKVPLATQKSSSMPGQTRMGKKSPVGQEQKDKTDLRGKNYEHMQDCDPVVTTEEQNLHSASLSTKWTSSGTDRMMTPDRSAVTGASSTTSVKSKTLSRSEEILTKGDEMFSPESGTTQILSSTRTSEELPAEGVETLEPESMESHIISTTRSSEELPAVAEASELHGSHSSSEPRAAPQELFDNTKYQNLQHFTYTPFTFVDMDVEMAKYRLPQPSSGRSSPRH